MRHAWCHFLQQLSLMRKVHSVSHACSVVFTRVMTRTVLIMQHAHNDVILL